jgi:O-antigen/teichoic acid export membrane protein
MNSVNQFLDKNNKSAYRQVLKATSLFGSVQIVQIFVQIIRSKFIAVLLGPLGMGIAGLLNTSVGFIGSLTHFGLGTSAVRNIADAASSNKPGEIDLVVAVLRRLVWITGISGMLITIFTAPYLSQIAFGNKDYTWSFVWISVSLLLRQISNGQYVLLQGLSKIKLLAAANLSGSIIGLIFTLPMYYFWGVQGIVPAIIVSAAATLLSSWFYATKLKTRPVKPNRSEFIFHGLQMLRLGFVISISGLISTVVFFAVRIYISKIGGLEDVGIYNAGFAIVNTYVGLIFTAMGTDYFPRLSMIANKIIEFNAMVNRQAEVAVLIIAPVIIAFIVFAPWLTTLLYSAEFSGVNEMIVWAALGMLFKAMSWAVGFIFLAKNSGRVFLVNEIISNCILLAGNIVGYTFFGFAGLGISFLVTYIIYLTQIQISAYFVFGFRFKKAPITIFLIQFLFTGLAMIIVQFLSGWESIVAGSVILMLSSVYSLRLLNNRIDFLELFNRKKQAD